ncbi:MAG TPA: sugar transferase, partial [Bacillota bacterium]
MVEFYEVVLCALNLLLGILPQIETKDDIPMYARLKRGLDLVLSVTALLLFWPLFLGIAVMIKLSSPGPVFFKQKRIGKGKRLFEIYKFRTMR